MKRMLINATHSEELRVALVDGQRLYDLDLEARVREQKKSNIYKARVTRVEPSLEAAFVEFGSTRHGFLPLKEISREYFTSSGKAGGRVNIKEVLKEGTELIVQVEKEERGNKGAALTTFTSLAGRYLVLMPNNPRAGGISRRIEGDERDELKDAISELQIPKNMGVIVRTAGVGRSSEELQSDLDYLVQLAENIAVAAQDRRAPFLIWQESDVIIRAIRDYLRDDIAEIVIDTDEAFEQAMQFVTQVMPQYSSRVKRYEGDVPLFSRYQIENQIESAFQREVRLPSGGSIVIDATEALVSIDINSSRATRGADIEETALNTNLEAAEEVCRQLRLRDIGGLIVIDFIDMSSAKNQRLVENRMRDSLEMDRARVQVGKISRFGLLEMSRQRIRQSLVESSGIVCPRCSGLGSIRDVESCALAIVRLVEEEALKETSAEIRAFLPVPVASFLLNEKRDALYQMEKRTEVRIIIIPTPDLETPHYRVERVRVNEEESAPSYELAVADLEAELAETAPAKPTVVQQAAVRAVVPVATLPTSAPANVRDLDVNPSPQPGMVSKLMKMLFGGGGAAVPMATEATATTASTAPSRTSTGRSSSSSGSGGNGRRRSPDGRSRRRSQESGRGEGRGDNKEQPRSPRNADASRQSRGDAEKVADKNVDKTEEQPQQDRPQRSASGNRRTEEGKSGDKRNQGNRQRGQQRKRSAATDVTPAEDAATTDAADSVAPLATTEPRTATPATVTSTEPAAVRPSVTTAREPSPVATSDEPHPSTLGRAANDPRICPGKALLLPVLSEYVSLPPAPRLEAVARSIDDTHPSTWGRAANDPRGGDAQPSATAMDAPESAVSG